MKKLDIKRKVGGYNAKNICTSTFKHYRGLRGKH